MSDFKPGNYSNIEKWRRANPNWRKLNAQKAAATKSRKKQAKLDALVRRKRDSNDELYSPSVLDVMRAIHADHGEWSFRNLRANPEVQPRTE